MPMKEGLGCKNWTYGQAHHVAQPNPTLIRGLLYEAAQIGRRSQIRDVQTSEELVKFLKRLPVLLGFPSAADFIQTFRTVHHVKYRRRKMTPAKLQILVRRTAQGIDRHAIAAELGVRPQTVSNIRYKLRLLPRSGRARRAGQRSD